MQSENLNIPVQKNKYQHKNIYFSQGSITRSVYLVLGWVVSQPFCVDKLNPATLISVPATIPIYLIDQVSSSQRRAERRNGKFKKTMKTRNILISIR